MREKMSASVMTFLLLSVSLTLLTGILPAQGRPDWIDGRPDCCTCISVGCKASADGWVTTSHTCDSTRTRSWLDITPARDHEPGTMKILLKRGKDDSKAMPKYRYDRTGEIPEVPHTHGYINTAYPCMNDHQLAIGESTFGGRDELRSKKGLIDCQQLVELMLERATTAREAIRLAGVLTEKYGYNDAGECLTVADTREVWHLEMVGPGKGKVGSVWAAQRVPDGHISVCANASRIRHIDISNSDFFMASKNVFTVAQEHGWWKPEAGPFEFCYAYDPKGRASFAARRREWRVFDLLAPSCGRDANAENHPFSVKPDRPVTMPQLVSVFQDFYEGTEYDHIKNITCTDKKGKTVISPLANPFMPYDMMPLFNINGGWGGRGERTLARWYTMYATLTQSRASLPDAIGGVVWLALDNVASSVYVPLYCGITDLPASYKTPGRTGGFTRDSAWWAFNRAGTLAAQRWGDMRKEVEATWKPIQSEMFRNQKKFEKEALALWKSHPEKVRDLLTGYSSGWCKKAVALAWKLGDLLWTRYDGKF